VSANDFGSSAGSRCVNTVAWLSTSRLRQRFLYFLGGDATDAAGHVQPEVPPWNRLGYGKNAIEVIYVDVR
jgi:hypothetical protein